MGARPVATIIFGRVYERAPINLPLPKHAKGALQSAVLGAWDHKFAIADKKQSLHTHDIRYVADKYQETASQSLTFEVPRT